MEKRCIYVVVTRTETKIAKTIRFFGKMNYNHTSIGLDSDLKEMYAFARTQYHTAFKGRLVHESLDRYTLNKNRLVPTEVFEIEVSDEQYETIQKTITQVLKDPEYIYNLFSVISYPITGGFATPKSFHCTEFVIHLLQTIGYPLDKPAYQYRPDDLANALHPHLIFKGDLKDYMKCKDSDESYFERFRLSMLTDNLFAVCKIFMRSYFS